MNKASSSNICFINGRIYTMAQKQEYAEAVIIRNERFAFVGSTKDALPLAGDCEVIDLGGSAVIPGLNDSHCHVLTTALGLERLDLRGVTSNEDIIRRGREYIQKKKPLQGSWIIGMGYDQNVFADPVLPDGSVANAISEQYPVMLERVCGHVGCANDAALAAVGYTADTIIPGGVIDLDENGHMTGVLREAALDRFKDVIPAPTVPQIKDMLVDMMARANAAGLTSMQSDDAEGAPIERVLQAYRELEQEGAMTIRIFEEVRASRKTELEQFLKMGYRSGDGSDYFKIGNIKLFIDGSLGARTALLREDYSDEPGNHGVAVYRQEELDELVRIAHKEGMQVACHAIGDGAVLQCVSAFEKAYATDGKVMRHRVVHCQFVDDELIERMKKAHIAADIQPPFVPSDMGLVDSRLGERGKGGYVWKTLLDNGILLGGGSDSPVESFSPIWGIYCAVNRQDKNGDPEGGWHPQEKLSVKEAVQLYTLGSAQVACEEQDKGSIEEGKLADFVVLDRDLFTIDPKDIQNVKVRMTVVGGRIVYDSCVNEK